MCGIFGFATCCLSGVQRIQATKIALLRSRRLCKDIGPVKAVWWMGVTPMTRDWQKSSGNKEKSSFVFPGMISQHGVSIEDSSAPLQV